MKRDRLPPDHEDYQSRAEVKRELEAILEFAHQLYSLPKSAYKSFPIPDELDAGFKEMDRIKSVNAQKRQWQFIAKVMRKIDLEPLELAYREFGDGRKRLAKELEKLEALREKLVDAEAGVFDTLITEHPDCDIQQLRQLIRAAQKEKSSDKVGKNTKKLFQALKELKGL